MPEYQHTIDIQVKFQTKDEADAFWMHLHGYGDVLGKMEDGIYIATDERPHVDISPRAEDALEHIACTWEVWA